MVCMWVLDTFLFSLEHTHINWLRDHTSWASSGFGMKIKSIPKYFKSLVLNFITPRYIILYMLSIANEVDSLIFRYICFCMRYKHVFYQHSPFQLLPLLLQFHKRALYWLVLCLSSFFFLFFFFFEHVNSHFNSFLLLVMCTSFLSVCCLFLFYFCSIFETKSWTMVPKDLFCGRSWAKYLVNLLLHRSWARYFGYLFSSKSQVMN